MKRNIQIALLLLIVILCITFYNIYLIEPEKLISQKKLIEVPISEDNQNNLIKNLKYEIKLENNSQYIISSELSEITYENNIEIVNMQNVIGTFIDDKNIPLTIKSLKAVYNNSNYNTNFSENVRIEYLDNTVLSENVYVDFTNNLITISNNVRYLGLRGTILADNIKIDLITKEIQIYMDDSDNVKIEILS
ncbi:LPS export ABC transporter periplasmic protein LptC [Candidatus Pelagibacter communis]|uniref:LPS export ABC transporter periplasmic protein LptC n=1 Tax=Pelagibacter ubique TaxID=198252 RepID=UPI00094D7E83|nr:LPS export ABC transporter periplasmic protein LptC [Candidatus Pelagibacter ubique]|tara:strand:- start:3253 stop:3828 length:576 start_codon:yes stop_codon:yes gene_type:complete